MEDMGMDMQGMETKSPPMDMNAPKTEPKMPDMNMPESAVKSPNMQGMETTAPAMGSPNSKIPGTVPVKHGPDHHGVGNSIVPMSTRSRLDEPGDGLENTGTRVLVYTDLKGLMPVDDQREPEREIELHLTGNMERFMWSFDGKKYSEAKTPIAFRSGERLRFTFVNDTMMEHPLHLHGMWMQLENGTGQYIPRKHTVSVKPAERVSVAITADAPGRWAFHCHLLLHMEMGMLRVIEVSEKTPEVTK
jgi:FtsP/CotA-like multicopper oxidase with cupredoxin domain